MTTQKSGPALSDKDLVTTDFSAILKIIIYNGLGLFLIDILFTYVVSRIFGQSAVSLGLVYALITAGNMISSPLTGVLADKYSKKRLVFIGSVGRGVSYFTLYAGILPQSFPIYMIGAFLLGFLTGFFWIPLNALISEKSHKHHRSFAFGRRDLSLGAGQLIGGIIGITIFSIGLKYTPAWNFFIFICLPIYGALNVMAGLLFLYRIDEDYKYQYPLEEINSTEQEMSPQGKSAQEKSLPNTNENPPSDAPRKALTPAISTIPLNRKFIIGIALGTIAFLVSSVNGALAKPYYQLFILDTYTDDATLALLVYLPTGIFALIVAPYLGKFADKLNPLYGICLISVCGAFITWCLMNSRSIWIFMILLIFDVATNSTANLLLEQLFSRITLKHRGKSFGTQSLAANLGGIIGQVSGGFLYDSIGSTAPFIVSIFVELSLIPLYLIALKLILPHLEEK